MLFALQPIGLHEWDIKRREPAAMIAAVNAMCLTTCLVAYFSRTTAPSLEIMHDVCRATSKSHGEAQKTFDYGGASLY